MLQYIIEITIFQLLFLLAFDMFLRKEKYFFYNRCYLLLTPLLSLLIPLLEFNAVPSFVPSESLTFLPEIFVGQKGALENLEGKKAVNFLENIKWGRILYFSGALFGLIVFLAKLRSLKNISAKGSYLQKGPINIVQIDHSEMAFSFWNTIFVGKNLSSKSLNQILDHEKIHVYQRHTVDLLFFELLKILLWFNPLIYILQSRVSECHEFLADSEVVKKTKKNIYLEQLLNTAFKTEKISFINQFFSHSLIKKRIVMLQKSNSRPSSKVRLLVPLPLIFIMLFYVGCSENPDDAVIKSEVSDQKKIERIKEIVNSDSSISEAEAEEIYQLLGSVNMGESSDLDAKSRIEVEELGDDLSNQDIPFSIIEEVPVYPGCEELGTNEERKNCLVQKVTSVVAENFDTTVAKKTGISGEVRVYVQFRIAEDGQVEIMGIRAPNSALESEARRVIEMLPTMTPGKLKGEKVGVLYSLPIKLKI